MSGVPHDSDLKFAEYSGALPEKKARPDIDKIHEWLPNAPRHWEAVRCVECHTPESTHSKLALSHEILDKEQAQRNCVSCHSKDTALRTRLYRHMAQEETNEMGFLNSAVLGDAYVRRAAPGEPVQGGLRSRPELTLSNRHLKHRCPSTSPPSTTRICDC